MTIYKMSMGQTQRAFVRAVALLILYIYERGYECSFGDASATAGHRKNSLHYVRLAIDLNLFRDGEYLTTTEAHREFGRFWKSLHVGCRWGGDFDNPDGNHYEMMPAQVGMPPAQAGEKEEGKIA